MLVKTLALEIPCEWWFSILGQESPSFPVQKLAKQRRCSTEHQHVGTSWSLQRRRSPGFLVTGHAGQEPIEDGGTDSILIRIYKAYFLGLCKGISPQNMARNMVLTYLHFRILEFPLIKWRNILRCPGLWNTEKLLGGAITILKNDGVRQWEGWHPIYEMENKIHVPNQ